MIRWQDRLNDMREQNKIELPAVALIQQPISVEVPKKEKINFLLPTKISREEADSILGNKDFDRTLVTVGGRLKVLSPATQKMETLFVVEEGLDFNNEKILMKKFPMGKYDAVDVSAEKSLLYIEMIVFWAMHGDERVAEICWWKEYETLPYYVITLIREWFEETHTIVSENIMYELPYIEIFKQYLKRKEKMVYFFFFKKVEATTILGEKVDFETLKGISTFIKRVSKKNKILNFEICEGSPVSNSETGESFIYTHQAINSDL